MNTASDTFRKLRQTPYAELVVLWNRSPIKGPTSGTNESVEAFFNPHGWTFEEFINYSWSPEGQKIQREIYRMPGQP